MIEFYDNNMSVCAQKVRLVLYEKDLSFDRHNLDLRAGDQFKPDYLKLNPKAVVPTIVHNGKAVTESTVIISYLDDEFPLPSLSPATAIQRATMLKWMILPDAGLHEACGLTSFALAFRMQLAHLEPEALSAHIAKMPDEKRRKHMRALVELGLEAPGVPEALRTYYKAIRSMDKSLSDSQWLAGDTYSLADVTLLPYVLRLQHLGLDWFWADAPQVADWLQRCTSRDAFRAITNHLDPKYLAIMGGEAANQDQRLRELLGLGS
ncbi:MAG TPA: glutathione S-transferase family protein [Xanthomonadales bacterium]|nr:glutathione S-transferase family protein [Xanthomonadales bacterium]